MKNEGGSWKRNSGPKKSSQKSKLDKCRFSITTYFWWFVGLLKLNYRQFYFYMFRQKYIFTNIFPCLTSCCNEYISTQRRYFRLESDGIFIFYAPLSIQDAFETFWLLRYSCRTVFLSFLCSRMKKAIPCIEPRANLIKFNYCWNL